MRKKIIAYLALGLALVIFNYFFPFKQLILSSIHWFSAQGPWGVALFALIFVACSLCFIPVSALMMAAGLLYGLVWGYLLVAVCSLVGIALAYAIGKRFLRRQVEELRGRDPRFEKIIRALGERGPLLVFLIRLNPVLPFTALNYIFTIPPLHFGRYLLSSWLGMVPDIFLYLYIGKLGQVLLGGEAWRLGVWNYAALALGLLGSAVAIFIIGRLVRRAMEA